MKLKKYQLDALDVLHRFLQLWLERQSAATAFSEFSKAVYQQPLGEIPQVCLKVPTGGGKTFMAAASLRMIFNSLPADKVKLAVWLVPSETILTQTYKNLSDPNHPYRQKLQEDFPSGVAVYTKEQLLRGEEFSPGIVENGLSLLVLSVDSFRRKEKDQYTAYQENGTLINFEDVLTPADILNRDDIAKISLINVIRHYNPVIIIDESHHTKTALSFETLAEFNPCFVLELTATPRKESNILTQVSSRALKDSDMVKIPVIVWNHRSQKDLISAAINLRENLESRAGAEGVRPIVLFQAESKQKGKEERATFDKIKSQLVNDYGIPDEQIAIKTAAINELPPNLMELDCPIRYIITINALKEGWDCPFAYILASLANRSSAVDVEQILGRILRRPFTKNFPDNLLNVSYAFTSSENFEQTLKNVTAGLNAAGFSEQDYRVTEDLRMVTADLPVDDGRGNDVDVVANEFTMRDVDAGKLMLPQFFCRNASGFIATDEFVGKKILCRGFNLNEQEAEVNFALLDYQAVAYDVNTVDDTLIYSNLSDYNVSALLSGMKKLSPESYRRQTILTIAHLIDNRYNELSRADIQAYVGRVMKDFSDAEIHTAFEHRGAYARKIINKIDELMTVYAQDEFVKLVDDGTIFAKPHYKFPETISLLKSTRSPGKTLYTAEFDDLNNLESRIIREIASWDEVRWWHRNIERQGFYINGFLNHYPDFVVMLDNGVVMLIEVKGSHLNNDDSRRKLLLGKRWAESAGSNYRYCMVFDGNAIEGAYNFDDFVAQIRGAELFES